MKHENKTILYQNVPNGLLQANNEINWKAVEQEIRAIQQSGVRISGQMKRSLITIKAIATQHREAMNSILQISEEAAQAWRDVTLMISQYRQVIGLDETLKNVYERGLYALAEDAFNDIHQTRQLAAANIAYQVYQPLKPEKPLPWKWIPDKGSNDE